MSRRREDIIDAEVLSEHSNSPFLNTQNLTIIGGAILALTVLAGIVWLLTQSMQQENQTASESAAKNSLEIAAIERRITTTVQDIEKRAQNREDANIAYQSSQQKKLSAFVNSFNKKLEQQSTLLQRSIDSNIRETQQLNQSIATLARRIEQREDNLHLSAALRLLQIAEEQLMIVNNLETTKQALTQANRQLGESGDPTLLPIQGMIREEIRLVNQVSLPDIYAATTKLTTLINSIDTIPFPSTNKFGGEPNPENTVAQNPADESSIWDWENILHKIWQDLLTLVRVEKREQELPAITSLAGQQSSRQILQLRLEQAQSALLLRDGELFRDRINSAEEWVKIFDQKSTVTTAMQQQLAELKSIQLSPVLPLIGQAHKKLKEILKESPNELAEELIE